MSPDWSGQQVEASDPSETSRYPGQLEGRCLLLCTLRKETSDLPWCHTGLCLLFSFSIINPFTPKCKKCILPSFQRGMYKWGGENCNKYNHLSSEWAMKSPVLHTVWCHISAEAAGEILHRLLLGVKGWKIFQISTTVNDYYTEELYHWLWIVNIRFWLMIISSCFLLSSTWTRITSQSLQLKTSASVPSCILGSSSNVKR